MARSFGPLHDLDDPRTFDSYSSLAEQSMCRNFAVQFNASEALSGLNLTVQDVRQLLTSRNQRDKSSCLWLNLWGWTQEHQAMIADIAQQYQLSPRLAHSMCPRSQTNGRPPSMSFGNSAANGPRPSPIEPASSMADIFNAVWHFGTVDFGPRYICIGWNALFFLPHSTESAYRSKPNALRLWSSILLCDDGTVISIFEDSPTADPQMISRTRQNQVNVFRNLSRAKACSQSALMQTSIRSTASPEANPHAIPSEMASLLFYYLFDDWLNMFAQVSGSEHSYRRRLELVRREMMEHARPEQIDLLNQLGKHLSALRSICKSYQSMIEQLVRNSLVMSSHSHSQADQDSSSTDTLTKSSPSTSRDAVRLPLGAVARFERLRDRIDLCAMTELDECVAEKEGLVQMVHYTPYVNGRTGLTRCLQNFNLIALKQAQTVERLTRTTILLAKVTTLFLPLSLAMNYFSMQLKDLQSVPVQTFWLTFMVVAIVAVTFLAGFEWLSAQYSGQLAYKGLTRILLDHRRERQKQ